VEALLRAAEHHMAWHGIEGADLKAIQIDAGQRNKSAVNYHFGGRDGLVEAIGIWHRGPIDARRSELLDRLEAAGTTDVADLAGAMVEPISECLAEESGRRYVIILAEAMARHGSDLLVDAADVPHVESTRRLNRMLVDELGGSAAARRRVGHAQLVTITLLADTARGVESGQRSVRHARRRSRELVGLVAALLTAPLPDPRRPPNPDPPGRPFAQR